jgi:hypothetical protein
MFKKKLCLKQGKDWKKELTKERLHGKDQDKH